MSTSARRDFEEAYILVTLGSFGTFQKGRRDTPIAFRLDQKGGIEAQPRTIRFVPFVGRLQTLYNSRAYRHVLLEKAFFRKIELLLHMHA